MTSRVREFLLILAISVGLFTLLELSVRLFLPQEFQVVSLNGLTLGVDDRTLGHLNRPGARVIVRGPEYSVEYSVNNDGLRDESVHPEPKPAGTVRILLLGDSFAWGSGVSYERIWPVVFERDCRANGLPVDVVKAGVSGYDTRQEVLYLERLLPLYHPDMVVLAFLPNDLFTNLPIAENDSTETARALEQDSLLVRNQGDKSSRLQIVTLFKRLLISHDYLYSKLYFNTDRSRFFTLPMDARLKRQCEITRELLSRGASYCQSRKTAFVVFSIPQEIQLLVKARDYRFEGIDVDFIDREFGQFARERGFPWIPVLPALVERYRAESADLFFRLDGHLNAAGNEVVGNYLGLKFSALLRGNFK